MRRLQRLYVGERRAVQQRLLPARSGPELHVVHLARADHRPVSTRQFKVGYCLLAKQSGSGQSAQMRAGLMTAVDCDAKRVPAQYNQILHITGVYKAPANPSASNCARVQGDRTYYWSWVVNGGRTLL